MTSNTTDISFYQGNIIRDRLGLIGELLDDETVTNIFINRYNRIYYDNYEGRFQFDKSFKSEREMTELVYMIANRVDEGFGKTSSILHANLPDGTRIQATTKPTNPDGTSMNLRLFRKKRLTLADLHEGDSWEKSDTVYAFLRDTVANKDNFLVAGSTNSGKSTFMNAMMLEIEDGFDHILTIEDVLELFLDTMHRTSLYTGDSISEGRGKTKRNNYGMHQLVETALRASPDRIFVGEIRQAQAACAFYDTLNTGHRGVGSTIHSNSGTSALSRLSNLITQTRPIPYKYLLDELREMMNCVIFLDVIRGTDGRGNKGWKRVVDHIYSFDEDGSDYRMYDRKSKY